MSSGANNGRRIVCAANRVVLFGKTYIFLGARHFDKRMRESMLSVIDGGTFFLNDIDKLDFYKKQEEGFIDTWGKFHNRKTAYKIAKHHNQIIRDLGYVTDELFSEHLY